MAKSGITSEEIATAKIEQDSETQKKLIKDSDKIINEAKYQISKIKKRLGAIATPEQASEVDIIGLQDNRSRLTSLPAQVKDQQILAEIDGAINEINNTIGYVIEIINLEISNPDISHDSEKDTINLDEGKYRVSLEIPNIGRKLCNVEVVDLTGDDEEIRSGEKGPFSNRPFKIGYRVARVTYVYNGPHNRAYHMDELSLLNESITKDDFTKRES
jgi:hypothetical protein